ncbi:GTP-binding protein 2-like [Lineus longissimus]|uniref:GTP-binding protein 2-like n=1 Tax=Lineus longissimus TaxID=88925 RepID=UPI002B4E0900
MDPLLSLFGPVTDETEMPETLPPEVEEGNVEYKLKLVNPSQTRFEHLVTQMKWRLQEGQGEAIYEIGVEDSGVLAGLTDQELDASLNTLDRMAKNLGASITILRQRQIESDEAEERRRAAEVLVRRVPDDQHFIDLRMAVLGNMDTGKSTLLGVLTQGELDNGRGRARLNLFRHLHEIQSGRTSSISHEIMGFNSSGEVVNYSTCGDAEEICEQSTKLITLIDLAGHQKYLRTTIFGLTGYLPHFAMLVVSATTGVVGTTKEHLGFAIALGMPVFVLISKIDICRKSIVNRTIEQLERILKSPGCKKVPMLVKTDDDAITAASTFNSKQIAPIFMISSVSGENLDLLKTFLNILPPLQCPKEREQSLQDHAEMQVDVVYTVPDVGAVVGGNMCRGVIRENDKMLIGPTEDGSFHPIVAHSIHRNKLPCRVVQAGQACSLGLQRLEQRLPRKGMVIVSPSLNPQACMSFEADIFLLFHAKCISKGFQSTVHIGNVRQTATIEAMDKPNIHTNQKAHVVFHFIKQPEFIRVGARLLFREGRTKGMGEVTKILPFEKQECSR